MVVLDASALIPLAQVGRLDLIEAVFDEMATTERVRDEVLTEGQPGAAALDEFLDDVTLHPVSERAESVAGLEGIAVADASVILVADDCEDPLLANDKALIEVARSHGVDAWWVTTLVLRCAKVDILQARAARDVLFNLLDAGMNLSPQVYARVQRKLDEIGS